MSVLKSYMVGNENEIEKLITYYPPIEAKNERGKVKTEFLNRYSIMYGVEDPFDASVKEIKQVFHLHNNIMLLMAINSENLVFHFNSKTNPCFLHHLKPI